MIPTNLIQSWRQAKRDRHWIAERGGRFTGAEALVISFTKSGRTWVRVMLSHLLHQLYGIPENELVDGDNFKRLDRRAPIIQFSPDIVFPPPEFGPPIHHMRPEQRAIFLLRDPRDVAVSFYHHVTKRAGREELRRKRIPKTALTMDLDEFVLDPWVGLERIIKRLNDWAEKLDSIDHHIEVRYEELHASPNGHLRRMANFLSLPVSDAQIEAAVAFSSFDAMKTKERDGFFDTKRLGATRTDDPDSAKVRQGKIGGYRDELRPETVCRVDAIVAGRLSPRFGYSGSVAAEDRVPKP